MRNSVFRTAFVVACSVLSGCGDADAGVYDRWRPVKILGKEKTFYSMHDGGAGTAMNRSMIQKVGGWGTYRGLNPVKWFNAMNPAPDPNRKRTDYDVMDPYVADDLMGARVPYHKTRERDKYLMENRPDVPILVTGFLDSWFPWFMKDKYNCDVRSFVEWKRVHTNFVAIATMNESDGAFSGLNIDRQSTNEVVKAYINAAFPPAKTYRDRVNWLDRAMKRQRAMYFGSDDFSSVYSSNGKWGHALAKYGFKFFIYENESQVMSGPWRFAMSHIRGVGRQYQIPWIWYAAHLIELWTRDGKTHIDGEWWHPNEQYSRKARPKAKENVGTARSTIKRALVYGYFAGANGIAVEKAEECLYEGDISDFQNRKLSKYGRDFEDVMQLAEKTPRGICLTPVAVLTSVYEPFNRSGGNGFGTDAFFFTLVPVLSEDGYKHRDTKNGDQGIMFNSEFGEMCDVLTPDAAQKPGEFAKALAPYKWAFMMGTYDERDFERGAMLKWVNAGGTLVTSVDYVTNGLVSVAMSGVNFGDATVTCGRQLVDATAKRVASEDMLQTFSRKNGGRDWTVPLDYELHVGKPTTAKPLYTDENGNVVVWENACGRGKVLTVTAVQGVPRILSDRNKHYKELPLHDFFDIKPEYVAGRVTFPIQRELLRKVQRETMPVSVEGDIQWGVNWVDGRFLVWLINNKGVKKFAFEEEEIDHAFDAKVKIARKKTGKTVEVTVPAGGYTWKIL